MLHDALRDILRFAEQGSQPLVLLTTLSNGVAEEIFFRGAVYAAVGEKYPVAVSTAVYTLATVATRNPALVVAAALMGTLFGLQRRASGGIQAPVLTHVTWATLMLRYLPPLFRSVES
ncbi:MAG: CPBP family intramembrane glutamic endopeptidase [Nocardioidaceae bacterium]